MGLQKSWMKLRVLQARATILLNFQNTMARILLGNQERLLLSSAGKLAKKLRIHLAQRIAKIKKKSMEFCVNVSHPYRTKSVKCGELGHHGIKRDTHTTYLYTR